LANVSSDTRFLVYSRGTGGGWTEPEYRAHWIQRAESRFPSLADKITAIAVPGGIEGGGFKQQDAAELVRRQVKDILGLDDAISE
jgi:hypothetical protein